MSRASAPEGSCTDEVKEPDPADIKEFGKNDAIVQAQINAPWSSKIREQIRQGDAGLESGAPEKRPKKERR